MEELKNINLYVKLCLKDISLFQKTFLERENEASTGENKYIFYFLNKLISIISEHIKEYHTSAQKLFLLTEYENDLSVYKKDVLRSIRLLSHSISTIREILDLIDPIENWTSRKEGFEPSLKEIVSSIYPNNILIFIPKWKQNFTIMNFSLYLKSIFEFYPDILRVFDECTKEILFITYPRYWKNLSLSYPLFLNEIGHFFIDIHLLEKSIIQYIDKEFLSLHFDQIVKKIIDDGRYPNDLPEMFAENSIKISLIQTIYDWIVELYCDLFSTLLVGEMYLYSLIALILPSGSLYSYGSSYPPIFLRLLVIFQALEENKLINNIKESFEEIYNYLKTLLTNSEEHQKEIDDPFYRTCTELLLKAVRKNLINSSILIEMHLDFYENQDSKFNEHKAIYRNHYIRDFQKYLSEVDYSFLEKIQPIYELSQPKTVFISYSWDSEKHKKWVWKLAEKLTENGVYVYLDIWDLIPGKRQEEYYNLIRNVVDYVIVVCTPNYVDRANMLIGGVAIEQGIIIGEILFQGHHEKFIPIIKEKGEESLLPTFQSTQIYIDFSDDTKFSEKFEDLLRCIYNKPRYVRPPLGRIPDFLSNSTSNGDSYEA